MISAPVTDRAKFAARVAKQIHRSWKTYEVYDDGSKLRAVPVEGAQAGSVDGDLVGTYDEYAGEKDLAESNAIAALIMEDLEAA